MKIKTSLSILGFLGILLNPFGKFGTVSAFSCFYDTQDVPYILHAGQEVWEPGQPIGAVEFSRSDGGRLNRFREDLGKLDGWLTSIKVEIFGCGIVIRSNTSAEKLMVSEQELKRRGYLVASPDGDTDGIVVPEKSVKNAKTMRDVVKHKLSKRKIWKLVRSWFVEAENKRRAEIVQEEFNRVRQKLGVLEISQ